MTVKSAFLAGEHTFLRAWRMSQKTMAVLGLVLLVLIAIRIALPFIVKKVINTRLNGLPDYAGHVEDIHLALWRGAYVLDGIRITKRSGGVPQPFFSARRIDFSLAWRELIHRKVVSDIYIDQGQINFIEAPTPESSQLKADRRWQDVARSIFPIDITRFEINDGALHFQSTKNNPPVDLMIEHLTAVGTGLRNRPDETGEKYPSQLTLEGESIGHGHLKIFVQGEFLAPQPLFELRLELENVWLPSLNNLLRAHANVDVSGGTFNLYTEMAAKEGRFEGYVKPFFAHIDFTDVKANHDKESVGKGLWELLMRGLVALFKNKPRDQLATKIPFSGEFGRTDVGLWPTIANLLHNGFVRALPQVLEGGVTPDEVSSSAGADSKAEPRPDGPVDKKSPPGGKTSP